MNKSPSASADNISHGQPSVVHVSFGTENFSQALARLRRSAKRVGVRDVRIYRLGHPAVRRALEENPVSMEHPRGAYYWVWKPYILLDTMDAVEEGTVIIYSDAGQRYVANPSPLVQLAASRDVVLFHSNHLQRDWTRRDCFVLMQADTPKYWDARQLDASIQIYRAGEKARHFLIELKEAMRDRRILCDGPNVCGLPDFEGFRAHRHDQSIVTILALKHGIETFAAPKIVVKKQRNATSSESVQYHSRPGQGPVIFEHHRRRNEPLQVYWRRSIGEFFGLS